MRGRCDPQLSMLAFVDLDARIPDDHPLRTVKRLADRALAGLSPVFDRMYAAGGRPSIPPERLLKASLLIALYSIRSERAFCSETGGRDLRLDEAGRGLATDPLPGGDAHPIRRLPRRGRLQPHPPRPTDPEARHQLS